MTRKRILFVCLGNVFRSALAERCCKQALARLGRADEFEVISRGIKGFRNIPPPPYSHPSAYPQWHFALPHLKNLEVNFDDHRATPVHDEDIQYARAIVAMDTMVLKGYEYSLYQRYPDDRDRMHVFGELDGRGDVDDLQYATNDLEGRLIVERIHDTTSRCVDTLISWAQREPVFAPL